MQPKPTLTAGPTVAAGLAKPGTVLAGPMRFSVASVTATRRSTPQRTLVSGVDGIGKSTFGAQAPSPAFLASEDGLSQIDAFAFPEPRDMDDVYAAISSLLTDPHDFRTLVIDTIDWLEPLLVDKLCKDNGWANIEAPGYGKGYTALPDRLRVLLARLDELRMRRGMEIIILAHSTIAPFSNPAGQDFSRYEIAIHKKLAAVLKQWVDCVLFATHEEFTTDKKAGKVKGVSTGKRVLKTERCAAWDAKNRYGLPPELPLDYAAFAAARAAGLQIDKGEVLAECLMLATALGKSQDTLDYLNGISDDAAALVQSLNRLRVLSAEAQPKE